MKELKINRFPKMVILQEERAILLGFDKEKAKIIGYAQAKKYAIFKNCRKGKKKAGNAPHMVPIEKPKILKEFRLTLNENELPIVGNKEVTVEEYEKYMKRFNQIQTKALKRWAHNVLKGISERDLKVESRFFNNVWKQHRDDKIIINN